VHPHPVHTFGQLLRRHREATYLTHEALSTKLQWCDDEGQGISVRTTQEHERRHRGAYGCLHAQTIRLLARRST
jgi:hypothetical protein